jgi:hypothetical protein
MLEEKPGGGMLSETIQLSDLIERYNRNAEAYKSTQYNETQLRREFLDPFFDALGWDVENKRGYAEAYKDVVHEDAIKIEGRIYCTKQFTYYSTKR